MSKNYAWNSVLVTGGGGGLGRAMAEHFLSLGKNVIIAGRTEASLKSTCAANPGLHYVVVDTSDLASLPAFVDRLVAQHPDVDAVCNNAGIQKVVDYANADKQPLSLTDVDAEIATNIQGVVHLTSLLLPHFLKKRGGAAPKDTPAFSSCVMTVSSGLAFVPLANVPVYSATKAFVHSWSDSLRFQVEPRGVRVIEIAPPLVGTDLHRDHADPENNKKSKVPWSLDVGEFLADFARQMNAGESIVAPGFAKERVKASEDAFGEAFKKQNAMLSQMKH